MPAKDSKQTATPISRRVFISYARKDSSSAAHQLRNTLRGVGCDVWLDTDRIAGGASWSRVIEDALNNCDVLIALLSEASFDSEVCRAEQMWALREDKQVIPVLTTPRAPRPLYLSTLNYRTYPAQESELLTDIHTVRTLATTSAPPLRYDSVPDLPQNFIPREQVVATLRDLVFTDGEQTNIAVTAVAGMGGVGKSVLATALCRDTAVQRAFPDGIAWITLGREWDGSFVPRMREVGRALGDDLKAGWDSEDACRNAYRTILREKAALVVVDDVWKIEHLKPFLVDARRSRLLFTTRDGSIAKTLAGRRYAAGVLSWEEARDLLARSAGRGVTELPQPESDQIIEACGRLALAVSQIGASMTDLSAAEWHDTVTALKNCDIGAIEEQLSGQESFFKSLSVSIQAVPPQMQDRYQDLAVLLEDVSAPIQVLRTLWRVDDAEARRTARFFVERSLGTWEAPDDPSRGIKLHDLQIDYVRACYPNREALDLIHETTRLAAHIIERDPLAYASQLTGRLLSWRDCAGVETFLSDLAQGATRPWLRPYQPTLHPPGLGLLRTLWHSSWVSKVVLTGDGNLAVAVSGEGKLTVWDLENSRVLHTLEGHSWYVDSVALALDGTRAVSASWDKTVKVWDLKIGSLLHTLEGHSDQVHVVELTLDGKRAISAADDNTLKVWDLESGLALRTLEGHTDKIRGLALTPDGMQAVSASFDGTLKVWDLDSGRELRTLKGHSSRVFSVALIGDGKHVISASQDTTLKVWDLERGCELRTLEGHSDWVDCVALTMDGKIAVSASHDKTLKVWDVDSGRALHTLRGIYSQVVSLALTTDGKRAVSASYKDLRLAVWDLEKGRMLRVLEGHSSSVNDVALTPDRKRVISASTDGTLKVWDLEKGRESHTLKGHNEEVHCVALTSDGRRAVSASGDSSLKVWDVQSGRELRTLIGHSDPVFGAALTRDGKRVVSASYDKTLKVWDVASGCVLRTLEGHSSWVHGVALTPDGSFALSGSNDHTLKLWQIESGSVLRTFSGHSLGVEGVALALDGKLAVSASKDETLKVWDVEGGRELRTLKGHSSTVTAVSLSADGRRAVSASLDKTVKVWDVDKGCVLRTMECPSCNVTLTWDGKRAFCASDTLEVWNIESGICMAKFDVDGRPRGCAVLGQTVVVGDSGGRVHFLRLEE